MSRVEYFLMIMILLVSISYYSSYSIDKKLIENKNLLKDTEHLAIGYDKLIKTWYKDDINKDIDKILSNKIFKDVKIDKISTQRNIEIILSGENIKATDYLLNKILNNNFKISSISISNLNSRVVIEK